MDFKRLRFVSIILLFLFLFLNLVNFKHILLIFSVIFLSFVVLSVTCFYASYFSVQMILFSVRVAA